MRIIWTLIRKDLRRDWKNPWTILLFSALPLLMAGLMAVIFGGRGSSSVPTVHVAILDQDKDLISKLLRSLSSQGEAGEKLRLHFVTNRQEGVRMLENREASAFVALPKEMTECLLAGRTNAIELYENPAEQILPKVVRQGVFLTAAGLSSAAELLGEPARDFRELAKGDGFPAESALIQTASQSIKQMGGVKTYLFPPLVQFQTISAADYIVPPPNPSPQKP